MVLVTTTMLVVISVALVDAYIHLKSYRLAIDNIVLGLSRAPEGMVDSSVMRGTALIATEIVDKYTRLLCISAINLAIFVALGALLLRHWIRLARGNPS